MMGFGSFGLVAMILFWIVLISLAVWLVSRLFPQTVGFSSQQPGGAQDRSHIPAEEILKERYARGEISKEQYDEMRRTLKD